MKAGFHLNPKAIEASLQVRPTSFFFLPGNSVTLRLNLLQLAFSLTCCFALLHFKGCCSDAEAQQTGRRQTPSQPIQCELPTVPVQIGAHFLKGISFNESAADNLKLKTVMTQNIAYLLNNSIFLRGS